MRCVSLTSATPPKCPKSAFIASGTICMVSMSLHSCHVNPLSLRYWATSSAVHSLPSFPSAVHCSAVSASACSKLPGLSYFMCKSAIEPLSARCDEETSSPSSKWAYTVFFESRPSTKPLLCLASVIYPNLTVDSENGEKSGTPF